MEQMKVPEERIIQLNYEDAGLHINVRELRPVIFEGSEGYYCVLGPDVQSGIAGSGNTIAAALANWIDALEERIKNPADDDEVALYAIDVLQASNRKVW
ncbi:hypothetical protein SAMN05421747_10836 [Parapedobacter composti]|uniref:Uncharacterized protein n=1 Tax=Parapedobacter composti TaxID=623281 RepID=A0A1I1IBV4_9SPHI|nr:hypothetical protein [Parapedobacter composti]SFC30780.1 hypothetical protein SAMN05421747_10836 [Parapedobacter composti]